MKKEEELKQREAEWIASGKPANSKLRAAKTKSQRFGCYCYKNNCASHPSGCGCVNCKEKGMPCGET
eukprot:1050465-Ditylum_brightwellii.AAC.1